MQALSLALDSMDKVFSKGDRDSMDGLLNVVCWLFQRVLHNNTSETIALVNQMTAKLTSDASLHPGLRLKT